MRNLVKHGLLLISLATLPALAACGGDDKPAQDPSMMSTTGATSPTTTTTPPPMPESRPSMTETRPVDPSMTTTPSEPTTPATPAEKPLTDAEIVAVTSSVNTGEIEMSQLAAKNATNPEVKNFAAMMLTQHRDMETKGKTIATKAKITPLENDAATMLKSDVTTTISTLKPQKGKDFDKAYIEAQVKTHREVLNTIDTKLLPNAQNGELRAHLSEARSSVASHLAKAEEIQQKLDAPATTPAIKPKKK
jgi:putative membrane protein